MKRDSLYVRSTALTGVGEFFEDLGGSAQALFREAGLSLADVQSGEGFVSWNAAAKLFERAAEVLDDPSLGIKWVHNLPAGYQNAGPMVFLASLVPTIRDFYELGIEYQKIHTNGVRYAYTERHEDGLLECRVHLSPLSIPCRQFMENILATCVLMERQYFGQAKFHKVQFQHDAPKDLTWHKKTFNCPIEFNADVTGAIIDLAFLDKKMDGKLKLLQPLLKLHLHKRLKKVPQHHNAISQLVQDLIPTILGVGNSGITRVADMMEVKPKKLQRLLKEEGVTYSGIIDDVRRSMAQRLLFESDMPVSHIAQLLDYSTGEAFNAACKRWTGMPPRKYREYSRQFGNKAR